MVEKGPRRGAARAVEPSGREERRGSKTGARGKPPGCSGRPSGLAAYIVLRRGDDDIQDGQQAQYGIYGPIWHAPILIWHLWPRPWHAAYIVLRRGDDDVEDGQQAEEEQ
eukprot:278868-Prymnesium_polylepis.1